MWRDMWRPHSATRALESRAARRGRAYVRVRRNADRCATHSEARRGDRARVTRGHLAVWWTLWRTNVDGSAAERRALCAVRDDDGVRAVRVARQGGARARRAQGASHAIGAREGEVVG